MVYGYIRVSTDSQTTDNQKILITDYAKKHSIKKIEWVSETISGTKNPEKRKLGHILETVQEGDLIIIVELSRLGRSLTMILNVIQSLMDRKAHLISLKEGYELGDNLQSKVVAFAFGLAAEIERTLISERTKAGLERARQNGKRIGRQKGEEVYQVKLRKYQDELIAKRKSGRSLNSLCKEYKVNWSTMKMFLTKYVYMDKPDFTEPIKKHGHMSIADREFFKNDF